MWWVFLLLLFFFIAVPSADYRTFSGLPLDSVPKFVLLVLLIPLAVSRSLRILYARAVDGLPPVVRYALLGAGAVAVVGHVALLASGTYEGYLACYRATIQSPPAGLCERSFDNPWFRFAATRIDRRLDFEPADWQLSFVNSSRFNFYPWVKGQIRRDRFPVTVTWRGEIERRHPWEAEVTYVGEGQISLDDKPDIVLPVSYGPPAPMRFSVPAGRHAFTLTYTFDDGSRTKEEDPPFPYATFHLRRIRGADPTGPGVVVPGTRPPALWRVLGVALDVVVVALALTIVGVYAGLLRPGGGVPALLALVTLATWYGGVLSHLVPVSGYSLLVGLLFFWVLGANRSRRLLFAYVALAALTWGEVLRTYPSLHVVEYRGAGDDPLAYESMAREILETWSLQGGEGIFYYQPLYRYWRFGEHFLFGDGDPLILIVERIALLWGLFWLGSRLWSGRWRFSAGSMTFGLTGILLVMLVNSTRILGFLQWGISEYPTWVMFPLLVPLLFASRRPYDWCCGVGLLGLSFLARTNHGPAVFTIFLIFISGAFRLHRRAAAIVATLFVVLILLPAAHNLYYGGKLVPVTRSATISENITVPLAQWPRMWRDPATRTALVSQLRATLYLVPGSGQQEGLHEFDDQLKPILHGLQLVWILVGSAAVGGWLGIPWRAKCLLLVPVLYLGVHLVYQVAVYYPRHIIMGHVAMGVMSMLALAVARGGARFAILQSRSGD